VSNRGRILRGQKGRKPKKAALVPNDEDTLGMVNQGLTYLEEELKILMGFRLHRNSKGQSPDLMAENWKKVVNLVKQIDQIGESMQDPGELSVDPNQLVKRGLEYLQQVLDTLTKNGGGRGEAVAGLVKAIQSLSKKTGKVARPTRPKRQRWQGF